MSHALGAALACEGDRRRTGTYYTAHDVCQYMAGRAIASALFDLAAQEYPSLLAEDSFVWRLLRERPDRYLPSEVQFGVDRELPAPIAVGLDDVARRGDWNRPADSAYAHPTETWREHAARRTRCLEVRDRLAAGRVRSVEGLITYNLDLVRFCQDAIEACEEPVALAAFHGALRSIRVLDPTCGPGAFLLAALEVLEPLHCACLGRMEVLGGDARLCEILRESGDPAHRQYLVRRSILCDNLFGVDISLEAVEACRARLSLTLEDAPCQDSRLAPRDELDAHIRSGNALVGYVARDEIKPAESQGNRKDINLDRRLARRYGVDSDNPGRFEAWQRSHRPFHWFHEFPEVMAAGGFHAIVGNPPYLELKEVEYVPRGLEAAGSRAIHAMCLAQSCRLLHPRGSMAMIVPLALVSTQRMRPLQELLETGRHAWYANFSWRPGRLFEAVNRALTIVLAAPAQADGRTYTTTYQQWTKKTRPLLISTMAFVEVPRRRPHFWVPKLGTLLERSLLEKCLAAPTVVRDFTAPSAHAVYYRTDGGLYWKVFSDFAPAFRVDGKSGPSSRQTRITLAKAEWVPALVACLSSDVFWWWYTISSNCRHLNPHDIYHFPLPAAALEDARLAALGTRYLADLRRHSVMRVRNQRETGRTETQSFCIRRSKPLIDQIDRAVAEHYRLSPEELDFVVNYQIKVRTAGFRAEACRPGESGPTRPGSDGQADLAPFARPV